MKFIVGHPSPQSGAAPNVYLLNGDQAVNLTDQIDGVGSDLMGLISRDDLGAAMANIDTGKSIPLSDITPAMPVARPSKVICLGLNYTDHIKEGGYDVPEYPALFMRGLNSLMPAGAPMILPECSEQLDYEAELMVIVGKGGKHISEANALSHVFGYTIFNDGSAEPSLNMV